MLFPSCLVRRAHPRIASFNPGERVRTCEWTIGRCDEQMSDAPEERGVGPEQAIAFLLVRQVARGF